MNNLGLLHVQKITAALQILEYGASVNAVDEIARIGESTILVFRNRFRIAIEYPYTR